MLTLGPHPLDGGAGPPGSGVHRRRLVRLCDRIDIHMTVPPLQHGRDGRSGERTSVVAARVAEARQAAAGRWESTGGPTNRFADLAAAHAQVARWSPQTRRALDHAAQVGLLSPRGVTVVQRLALTIADLDGRDLPIVDHVREAIWLRTGHEGDSLR